MAIRPLSFIGDRDAPDPLSAVHARRPILGSGKLPKDLVEISKTRSYYVHASLWVRVNFRFGSIAPASGCYPR